MDLGLRQSDVAKRFGAHEASVYLWEKDRAVPELKWWPAILEFIGYDPRPEPTTIAERLVRFRAGLGWSQKRLAKALDVDPATLSRWEQGKRNPWGVYRQRIATLVQ